MRKLRIIVRYAELKDPRIHPLTSVLSADVTTDLKQCKAYISVLGDADAKKETMEGLRAAASFIRHELAAQVNLRNTPAVTFVLDERIEQGMHMSRLIEEVKARDDAAIALRSAAKQQDRGAAGQLIADMKSLAEQL